MIFLATNEIEIDTRMKDPCAEARYECSNIQCPYGKEIAVDNHDCERCRCADPCRSQNCPEGTQCSITLVATKDGNDYRAVCRESNFICWLMLWSLKIKPTEDCIFLKFKFLQQTNPDDVPRLRAAQDASRNVWQTPNVQMIWSAVIHPAVHPS